MTTLPVEVFFWSLPTAMMAVTVVYKVIWLIDTLGLPKSIQRRMFGLREEAPRGFLIFHLIMFLVIPIFLSGFTGYMAAIVLAVVYGGSCSG
jgi:hypothetical protein